MSELTEDQKLVKLGLRSPNQTQSAGSEIIQVLKDNIAEDWSTFQTEFDNANLSSWGGFESWLESNGVATDTASNIRNQLAQKYPSFSDFSDKILNTYTSWVDFANDFASNSGLRSDRNYGGTGLSAAGVKMYEEPGIGRSGQRIPAGGIEMYGAEVYFSKTGDVQKTKQESSSASDPIVWSNLVVDPNTANLEQSVTVEADVTNNADYKVKVVGELIVDGKVDKTKTRELAGNTTETISFNWVAGVSNGNVALGTFTVGVSKAGSEDVTVVPEQVI